MDSQLVTANIVLLAEQHNPSLLSAEWLKSRCSLDEPPKQMVSVPHLFFFESASTQVVCEPNRLQIVAKNQSIDPSKIGVAYVSNLPHVKYTALGLNFIWRVTQQNDFKISMGIDGVPLKSEFLGYSIEFGGVIYFRSQDDICKAVIEKVEDGSVAINFNFHFDCKEKGIDYLKERIAAFSAKQGACESIIKEYFKKVQ